MKKLITILSLILFATIVTAQKKSVLTQEEYLSMELTKEISKESIAQGGDDYYGLIVKNVNKDFQGEEQELINFVIARQCKAFCEFFSKRKPFGMPKNAFEDMKAIAMDKWTVRDSAGKLIEADWIMVLQVYKIQIKAYSEIF